MATLLAGRALSKRYVMEDVHVTALHDVDFDLADDELVVLLGPSGQRQVHAAEHSRRARRPSSGEVSYRGTDLSHLVRDLVRLRGQVVTIALVVACGIATLVTFVTLYRSLEASRDAFYEDTRFGDVFVHADRAVPVSCSVTDLRRGAGHGRSAQRA